jgi:hypothetical protein
MANRNEEGNPLGAKQSYHLAQRGRLRLLRFITILAQTPRVSLFAPALVHNFNLQIRKILGTEAAT